jgi:aspartate carbamoyltransferase catalytic subunit
MGLRVQWERLDSTTQQAFDQKARDAYIANFRLDPSNLAGLHSGGLIMHPGPFVPHLDFDPALLADPRCAVHRQVSNGVFVRAALLVRAFGLLEEFSHLGKREV